MRRLADKAVKFILGFAVCLSLLNVRAKAEAGNGATIRRISVLAGSTLELEISASAPLKPEAHMIRSPDRLILDFPGTTPAKGLRNLEINRGDVKDARVGLFSSTPPITRIVLDMSSPQPYKLFPSGNTVVVKFGSAGVTPVSSSSTAAPPAGKKTAAEDSNDSAQTVVSIERPEKAKIQDSVPQQQSRLHPATLMAAPAAAVQPRIAVVFENGLLSIRSNKANLSEVLYEVHRRTGAEIEVPPAAASEQVFTSLGPGAPKEVLASLLNGSHFNFIVIGSERDPGGIRRVVLTPKQGGAPEAVVYPCGTIQPSQPAIAQVAPDQPQPSQAFEPPMPPESDASEPPPSPPPASPPQPEQ